MEMAISSKGPRVLMVGYNGANNTGSEALLQADIEDIRAVLGPDAHITIPTLNEGNLRRYLKESRNLRIVPVTTLYFSAFRRLIRNNDLVLLVEGSTYMDTWGSPLLWAFLWATRCAAALGKPSLAYAVDAGTLSPGNRKLVRKIASRTDLIVTRNKAAAARLRDMGVTAPMDTTADNAFTFQPREEDRGWVSREWSQAADGVVGLAMVDFTLWPVVLKPWGKKEQCYKWPYYFSSSARRRHARDLLARGYASLADHIAATTGKAVALISMEQVDGSLAARVHQLMAHPGRARQFSAAQHDASRMTSLLRSLDLLVTSRFHAGVLSLAAGVPQVAVGHDTRLATLYQDLGLKEEWFMETDGITDLSSLDAASRLFGKLRERVDRLLADPELQQERLVRGYEEHLGRARRNRRLLEEFIARKFGMAHPHPAPASCCQPAPAIGLESSIEAMEVAV